MGISYFTRVFYEHRHQPAIIWNHQAFTYQWLSDAIGKWRKRIEDEKIESTRVTILDADFSPNAIALFFALVERSCIVVPLMTSSRVQKQEFTEIAQGEILFGVDHKDHVSIERLGRSAQHDLYSKLRARGHSGLILFSSGSTGKSKAALHDLEGIFEKFYVPRKSLRTLAFLLFDHIGGLNTMLYALSNGGCLVTVQDRTIEAVLHAIEAYDVELLPTSPTFINMILLSKLYKRYRLDSLRVVTYGTEPMPESTLSSFHSRFPNIRMQQTYGLSEVGILRSKSEESNSLWVKLGGKGFQTRVVDGILHIKAKSSMLGYLNAPSPFTGDGWLNTGDAVEIKGDYIKILGRKSEIINVGGEKVYPAEVENVIQQMNNIAEVTVYGEKNAIMGNIVCAKVTLLHNETPSDFVSKLKQYCRERLDEYKVPVRVKIVQEKQYSDRLKKIRNLHP